MKFWIGIFLFSLLLGQLGGFNPIPGLTVYLHDITGIMLFFFAAFKLIRERKVVKPALILPISLFVLAGTLSLVVNAQRFSPAEMWQSALYLGRWLTYAFIYLVVVQSFSEANFWLWGTYFLGIGLAFLGLVQYVLYPDLRNLAYLGWDPHYYRLFSTLLDPNFAGIIIVLTIFLGIFLWRTYYHHRTFLFLGQSLSFLALLLTYSRSSFLAFLGALIVFLTGRRQTKLLFLLVFLFIILFLVWPLPKGDALRLTRTASTVSRIDNWKIGLELFRQSPVFGVGFNTLRWRYIGGGLDATGVMSKAASGLDNSLLFVAVTSGLVGFASYGYLWLGFFFLGRGSWRKVGSLALIYLSSLTALLIHSLFVNSLFYPWVMIWIWIVTGVLEKTVKSSKVKFIGGK